MAVAEITRASLKYSANPVVTVRYVDSSGVGPGAQYAELLELPLLAQAANFPSDLTPTGSAYAIDLNAVGVSCLSNNYSFRVFSKNDMTQDTIDEVLVYTNINLSAEDVFPRFYIENNDEPISRSCLYVLIQNYGGMATGPISFELTYNAIHTVGTLLL
jgi:hypothetical protein